MNSNKYHNKRTKLDSITFASKKEASRYTELKLLLKAGEICNLTLQKRYNVEINGIKICTYIADFVYFDKYGKEYVEDVKGMKSGAAYRIFKMKASLMMAIYGIYVLEV